MSKRQQQPKKTNGISPTIVAVLICATTVLLMGFESRLLGGCALVISLVACYFMRNHQRHYFYILMASIALLAVSPVHANIFQSGTTSACIRLIAAVLLPYFIFTHYYHDKHAYLKNKPLRWDSFKYSYLLLVAAVGFLVIPWYFHATQQYSNWSLGHDGWQLFLVFVSLMFVGAWDELFFIASVFGIFRKSLTFWKANIFQAIIFASFLFSLGFKSWAFIPAFLFALFQGYIFMRTKSLAYAITVHLTFDVILFFGLLHAYHPGWPSLFLT